MSPIIHRKQFADGRMTPQEMFAATAFPLGAKCACGRPPVVQISIYMPLDEARKQGLLDDTEGFEHELHKMLVQIRQDRHSAPEPYITASRVFSCKSCRPLAEKVAAMAPSYCYVDRYDGPKESAIITSG